MALAVERNALTHTVQNRHPVACWDAGTNAGNWNIEVPLKPFNAWPVAPPGTKEKFVIFTTSEGVPCSIMRGQGTISWRKW